MELALIHIFPVVLKHFFKNISLLHISSLLHIFVVIYFFTFSVSQTVLYIIVIRAKSPSCPMFKKKESDRAANTYLCLVGL